jgi:ATP-binding cassette, subfamily B, bacterial
MPPKTLLEFRYRGENPANTLWQIFSTEKKNVVLSLLVLTVKHSPALVLPIIMGNVINAILSPGEDVARLIWINTSIITVLLLQNIFTHTLFVKFLSRANRSVERNIRYALLKRMQELSIAFHDNFESGRVQTKVLRDVESIEILSRQLVNVVFTGMLNVVFVMVVTLAHNWIIALFFLVTVPLANWITRVFREKMVLSNKEYRLQIELMSARLSEMVQMIPITRAHAIEETELSQMNSRLEMVKEKGYRLDMVNAFFGSSAWVTFQLFQFICLLVTAFMAYKGQIEVGDVVMFQGFFAMIINSVSMIINVFPEVNRGFDSLKSLGEILECPDIEHNEGKTRVDRVDGNFRFESISFQYTNELSRSGQFFARGKGRRMCRGCR